LLDFVRQAELDVSENLSEDFAEIIESDLLFVSPVTGRHFHASPIGQDYIRPAGCCLVDCPKCGAAAGVWCETDFPVPNGKRLPLHDERWDAAGKYGGIGWHTFRRTCGSAAEAHAARPDLDHDERLRQRADGSKAGSQCGRRSQDIKERITHDASVQTCENPAEQKPLLLHRVIPGWKFR